MTSSNGKFPMALGEKVIFDPSVDYLHVNSIHFEMEFKKAITGIYGDSITCTENSCFFESSCDQVEK